MPEYKRLSEEAKAALGLSEAILDCLISPSECDQSLQAANVVDGLFAIARAMHDVADAIRSTKDR